MSDEESAAERPQPDTASLAMSGRSTDYISGYERGWEAALDTSSSAASSIAALKQDAARYCWLRDKRTFRWEVRYWNGQWWETVRGDDMDAAIDAALASGEGL